MKTGDQVNKSVALQFGRSKYFIDGIYGMNSSKSISDDFICRPFHFFLSFSCTKYTKNPEFNSIAFVFFCCWYYVIAQKHIFTV